MSKSAHLESKLDRNYPEATGNQPTPLKLSVGRELADTTWRITVPVLLFAGLGLMLDRATTGGPWLTVTGMIIGFGFAALLVKRQIDRMPVKPLSRETLDTIQKRNQAYDAENDKNDYYGSGDNK